MIHIKHCGVDEQAISKVLESDGFKNEYEKLKEQTRGKIVIGSFDRLSVFSGIPEKLAGYKKFLERFVKHRDKIKLIQVLLLNLRTST
jgi:trehalose-6-phosphate synthase